MKKEENNNEKGDKEDNTKTQTPLKGLKSAFAKIRKNEKLNNNDCNVVRKFVDEFTTVSTHRGTVGKVVATIAEEVNKKGQTF